MLNPPFDVAHLDGNGATATNLAGATRAWQAEPLLMDFLDPQSPVRELKLLERSIYLDRWAGAFRPGARVLDLGGGIGRMVEPCLDRRCDVVLVDIDAESLGRAKAHFGDRVSYVHANAESLPELGAFDVVIACELLNYVDNPAVVLANARQCLRVGGTLLVSVEAAYGWAMGVDAPAGQIDALLAGNPIEIPDDRWVRTYTPESLRECLAAFDIFELVYTHFVPSGPFEIVAGTYDIERVLALESQLRAHPVLGQLGRALTVTAHRPE